MKRFKLLGINIDSIDIDEVYRYILNISNSEKPGHIVLLDTYLLVKSIFNRNLHNFINSANLVIPISSGIKFGMKFLNLEVKKIYNYYNFLISLLLYFTEHDKFIYILGGKKKNIENVERNIKDSFQGIRLVGKYHAQYKRSFDNDLLTAIKKTSPALILVGMSSPKQEKWINSNMNKFSQGVFIGVGEFINIVGSRTDSFSSKYSSSSSYKINRKLKNPLRIFYYMFYFILLIFNKIFKKGLL